jgi:single-strand DNA-binding protein
LNETTIAVVGNLTADPELRYTQGGKAVANFTIASTPRTFDRQANEFKDGDALFLRCTAWEEFAEHIAGSLVKSSRVIAQGNLQQKSYDDKEGGREPQGARSEQQQAQDWAQPGAVAYDDQTPF